MILDVLERRAARKGHAVHAVAFGETNDVLAILLTLGGLTLAVAATSAGTFPCPLCFVFWVCVVGLLLELMFSRRKLGPWASRAAFAASASALVVAWTPVARSAVAAVVPTTVPAPLGPQVGSEVPLALGTTNNGYIAFVTDCQPCWANALHDKVTRLADKGEMVTLVTIPQASRFLGDFPKLPQKIVHPKDFSDLRLKVNGPPYIVQIKNGRIVAGGMASTFDPKDPRP